MILHEKYLHILVMIPHSQVTGIGYRVTRLIMNALVIFVMAYLISLDTIRHIMSSQKWNLALRLGALLFLSMQRYLGALVTLHLPSRWWKLPHMSVLGLVLVVICGYQNRDE